MKKSEKVQAIKKTEFDERKEVSTMRKEELQAKQKYPKLYERQETEKIVREKCGLNFAKMEENATEILLWWSFQVEIYEVIFSISSDDDIELLKKAVNRRLLYASGDAEKLWLKIWKMLNA